MKWAFAIMWVAGSMLAALCRFFQFSFDHFGPSAAAGILFVIIWHCRPSLRVANGILAGFVLLAFVLNCTLLRHRLAVESRSWSPVWDCEEIVDILLSPSGRYTAYIFSGGFLDSAYRTYISDGGFSPKHCDIDTDPTDAYYPKNFSAAWAASIFTVAGVQYNEETSQLTTSIP